MEKIYSKVDGQLLHQIVRLSDVTNGRKDLSHLLLDLLTRDKYWAEGNDYNLKELREKIQNGEEFNTNFDINMKLIDGICVKDL